MLQELMSFLVTETALKLLFVTALLGMTIYIYQERKDPLTDISCQILCGIIGFFVVPAGTVIVVGIVTGIAWLFS